MRASNIRNKDNKTLSSVELKDLCRVIVATAAQYGFITDAEVISGGAIKIALHMSSFRIDTHKLGHNARIGRYVKSPKGYKRTDVPTWEQREGFNHLINDVFDKRKLSARIVSGPYDVRSKSNGRIDEWYPVMGYTGSASYNGFGELIAEVITEKEARQRCDSDKLEAEHKEATREHRRSTARAARMRRKAFEMAPRVVVSGFYEYHLSDNDKKRNGKLLTHKQFNNMLTKLNKWEARRVRLESMKATAKAYPLEKRPELKLVYSAA